MQTAGTAGMSSSWKEPGLLEPDGYSVGVLVLLPATCGTWALDSKSLLSVSIFIKWAPQP